jgi:hypothetical protein
MSFSQGVYINLSKGYYIDPRHGVFQPIPPNLSAVGPETLVGFLDVDPSSTYMNALNTSYKVASAADWAYSMNANGNLLVNMWGYNPNASSDAPSGTSQSEGLSTTINPFGPFASGGYIPFDPSVLGLSPSLSGISGSGVQSPNNNSAGNDQDLVSNVDHTDTYKYNARLKLIEQYCKKYGDIVDIAEIKERFTNNPTEGLEYCNDIINNTLDQNRLEKIVKKQYNERLEAQLDKGRAVSDDWVDTALKSGLDSSSYNTNVNKNNVLDVIGTFMTNKEVKDGKVSLENIFEQPEVAEKLMDAIKAKSNEMLKRTDLDSDTREEITTKLADLVDYVDNFSEKNGDEFISSPFEGSPSRRIAVGKYTELFETLRTIQAEKNDEASPEYYGLPEDTEITFDGYTKRAEEEISAHKSRKKLRTNI